VVVEQADRLLAEVGAYIGSAEQSPSTPTSPSIMCCHRARSRNLRGRKSCCSGPAAGVEWFSDLGAWQFGTTASRSPLYDPATPFYASEAAARIDSMLDQLVPKLDFAPPLADFLYRDPYKSVRANIQYGFDLGHNDVNGRTCRTLAFVEKNIDWQIWIENGPQPTPCALVITYKTQPAQPQFTAVFRDWDFAPRIAEAVFTPGYRREPRSADRAKIVEIDDQANPAQQS
jgi:hypothetical protein